MDQIQCSKADRCQLISVSRQINFGRANNKICWRSFVGRGVESKAPRLPIQITSLECHVTQQKRPFNPLVLLTFKRDQKRESKKNNSDANLFNRMSDNDAVTAFVHVKFKCGQECWNCIRGMKWKIQPDGNSPYKNGL